ncbi:hypothetical protein PHLGIDRAFT_112174 [Phlebiopsis gigantea 11061_1 CR5-6]|uniref:C2H2-type domain-containing protein n=1 Tax=Phlebiopsis gigantea (strain 11061_1 CR5-6) TaxID=745531 RepID=A0A0C3S3C7_PHLG1|nr:hypothetical protein PHLGIDRAFT_112174 [Phlebiopsis gigantea 11061_1 CR5-6]
MTTKRAHSTSPEPSAKLARAPDSQQREVLCTLPPTCNHSPTRLAGALELEKHYATYHAHVCEDRGCGCVFPDARLLELHQTECHDPLAALKRERGEKIFACHLTSCDRLFSAPKARRLHLIQAHGYPKEYFFAVTNKGVGGLLKRWGEGASMIRGEWKPREKAEVGEEEHEDESDATGESAADAEPHDAPPPRATWHERRASLKAFRLADGPLIEEDDEDDAGNPAADAAVDGLAGSMGSLSLVPASVRFGRGAKGGGLLHSRAQHDTMDVDGHVEERRGRRHGRGRGRGKEFVQREQREEGEKEETVRRSGPPMPPRGLGRRAGFLGRGRIHIGSRY